MLADQMNAAHFEFVEFSELHFVETLKNEIQHYKVLRY